MWGTSIHTLCLRLLRLAGLEVKVSCGELLKRRLLLVSPYIGRHASPPLVQPPKYVRVLTSLVCVAGRLSTGLGAAFLRRGSASALKTTKRSAEDPVKTSLETAHVSSTNCKQEDCNTVYSRLQPVHSLHSL